MAFRVWVVTSPLGLVDGDEAVVGLMARRVLEDGGFEAFFWGQEYGGSQEALLVALLLVLRVPARWAMELVPIGLHLGAAALVWRIGRRTIDRPGGAALAAGICWAGSPALLWWSTKERGFYGVTLVCGLAALLFGAGLQTSAVRRPSPNAWRAVGLGVALGVGWWASPQILHFAVPGLAWLAWSHRARWRDLVRTLAIAAPAAVVGALPWLWANAHTGLASLDGASGRATFGDPLPIFFQYGLPMVLGLRAPITLGWEWPGAVVVYGAVLVGLALVVLLRPKGLGPVLPAVAAFPLVFALLPTTYYYGEPRYLDYLWPLLALVAGWALVRLPVAAQAVAVAAFLAVTAHGLAGMVDLQGPPGEPFEDVSPTDVDGLVRALDDVGADRAFADYWVAYRLTWETDGRIVASPLQVVRDERTEQAVEDAAHPVFVEARRCEGRVQAALEAAGRTFRVTPVDGWDVVVPDEPVRPGDVPGLDGC